MIPLHTLKVASPCHADWDQMEGDDQVRFCGGCRKNVYNLSEMTHDEAQALVSEREGRLCVRFYTRADGTLLTQECPVGLGAVRRKLVKKLSYAAAVLLSCAAGLVRWPGAAQAAPAVKKHAAVPRTFPMMGMVTPSKAVPPAHRPRHTMGKIAAPVPPMKHTMGAPLPPKL